VGRADPEEIGQEDIVTERRDRCSSAVRFFISRGHQEKREMIQAFNYNRAVQMLRWFATWDSGKDSKDIPDKERVYAQCTIVGNGDVCRYVVFACCGISGRQFTDNPEGIEDSTAYPESEEQAHMILNTLAGEAVAEREKEHAEKAELRGIAALLAQLASGEAEVSAVEIMGVRRPVVKGSFSMKPDKQSDVVH
jgi:hypothetical protein